MKNFRHTFKTFAAHGLGKPALHIFRQLLCFKSILQISLHLSSKTIFCFPYQAGKLMKFSLHSGSLQTRFTKIFFSLIFLKLRKVNIHLHRIFTQLKT